MKITDEQGKLIMEVAKASWNKSYRQFPYFRDDALGYTYLQMCKSLNKYDENKNVNLKTYLNTVASNSFKKFMRDEVFKHKDRYVDISISEDNEGCTLGLEELIGVEDTNYTNMEFRELINRFDRYIENKNKRTSRKIDINELHYIIKKLDEGYNRTEISKMLGVSATNINKKVNRMREIIKEISENN